MPFKEYLKCGCLAFLLFILAATAQHLPGWLKGVDHLLEQAQIAAGASVEASRSLQQASDTTNMAATEALNVVGTLNSTLGKIDHRLNDQDGTLDKVDAVLDNAATLEGTTNTSVEGLNTKVLGKDGTVDQLNVFLDDLHGRTNKVMDDVPPFLQAGTDTLNAATASINKFGTLSDSFNPLAQNLGKISGDAYIKMHPFLNPDQKKRNLGAKIWGTILVGAEAATPVGRAWYYWSNSAH